MKERPIIFSAPMVRAILEGRKCQTRRVVKHNITGPNPQHSIYDWRDTKGKWVGAHGGGLAFDKTNAALLCPYGVAGDMLWVRESGWERPERTPKMMREGADTWPRFAYAADGWSDDDRADFKRWGFKARPSIHMPRWASRILLEVAGVRVERLNDISPADCVCEGYLSDMSQRYAQEELAALDWYRDLWESINGPGSWAANPWVWVIEFRRIKP